MIVRGCVEPSSGSTDHKSTQTAGSVHATLVFPDFAQDPPPTPRAQRDVRFSVVP
jgi:hypothetical protein